MSPSHAFVRALAWLVFTAPAASAHPDLPKTYNYSENYKNTLERVRALRKFHQLAGLKQDDPNRPVDENSGFVGTSEFGRCGGPSVIHVDYFFGELPPLRYELEQNDRHPGFHNVLGSDFESSNEIRIQGDQIHNQHVDKQGYRLPLSALSKLPDSDFYLKLVKRYRQAAESVIFGSGDRTKQAAALKDLKDLRAECDARDPALRPGAQPLPLPKPDLPASVLIKLQMACYFGLSEFLSEGPGPAARLDDQAQGGTFQVLAQAVAPGGEIPPGLYLFHSTETSSFLPHPKLGDSSLAACGGRFLYALSFNGQESPRLVEVSFNRPLETRRVPPSLQETQAAFARYDDKKACVISADEKGQERVDESTRAILEEKARAMLSKLEEIDVSKVAPGARTNVGNRIASCLSPKLGFFENSQERVRWNALARRFSPSQDAGAPVPSSSGTSTAGAPAAAGK